MAERPVLEAVIFDAGGTLVRLDFEWIAQLLGSMGADATAARVRAAEMAGRRAFDAAAGADGRAGPVEAYWGAMLLEADCPAARLDEAIASLHARQRSDHFLWARPVERAREAMDALPALGVRLACVSNSDGRAEEHLVRFGLRDGLEFVIDSQRVGIEKPDPRIFALALERLGVAPARALYVGDLRSVDEVGAHAAGMRFVLLDPVGDYARPGTDHIADIGELPRFVAEKYRTPAAPARRP